MKGVTPQMERILEIHRDMQWHCSTEYEFIRDHRKRISTLNTGYLFERGYQLVAKKCDGRCGKSHNSMVAMRRAEPLGAPHSAQNASPRDETRKDALDHARSLVLAFDAI